ncbi:MAG: flippase, partial [Patescibacteria group bacterium]
MFQKIKSFLLENQTVRQTVAKNTFWLAVSNIGGRLLRAVIIIYAARVLGAAEWGVFSYAIGLAALLTIFTDLGIGPTITRETAKIADPGYKTRILSTAFFIKLAILAIGVNLVLFIAPHFTSIEKAKMILPIIAFVLIFDSLRQFGFSLIQALERMEWEAGLYLITNVAIVAFGFLFLTASPTVSSFTYAYALGTGVGMAATYFVLKDKLTGLFTQFSRKLVRTIFSSAWPFAVSTTMAGLMINTDIILIGYFLRAEDVGFYSAADRITQILYLLPAILAAATFPTIARLTSEGTRVQTALERSMGIAFMLALPLALGGLLVAPDLVTLLFGNSYLPATLSLQILFLTMMLNFPSVFLMNAIFAFNEQKKLVLFAVIGGATNVILDLILIPFFGIAGSAWATFIAQLVSNIYLWRVMKKIGHFAILPRLVRIIP